MSARHLLPELELSPKGSPQKGELLAHHMVCPPLASLFHCVEDPVGQKCVLHLVVTPKTCPSSLVWGK